MTDIAAEFNVAGRVQGVWYRGWTQKTATAMGLCGWVRNEPDGTVSGYLSGPEDAVLRMLKALEDGPPHARVTRVTSARVPADPEISGFDVRR